MKDFNLADVMGKYCLSRQDTADILFPDNKFKTVALDRILDGQQYLDTAQIERLAEHLGVLSADLFNIPSGWKLRTEEGFLTFRKGEYKAVINYNGSFVTVMKNGDVTTKFVIDSKITLSALIKELNILTK